jgi:hypothetical protein
MLIPTSCIRCQVLLLNPMNQGRRDQAPSRKVRNILHHHLIGRSHHQFHLISPLIHTSKMRKTMITTSHCAQTLCYIQNGCKSTSLMLCIMEAFILSISHWGSERRGMCANTTITAQSHGFPSSRIPLKSI